MNKQPVLKDDIPTVEERAKISYPEEASDKCFEIEEKSFWFKHRNDCILEAIKSFSPGGEIYDVGGGNGFVSAGLKKNGFSATLIEPNPAGAANARKRGLKKVICATLENAGLPPGKLAAIGIFDVLEHIENEKNFLLGLKKYLREDGRLYLTVPAHNFLWSADDDYAGHFRRYSPAHLREVLAKAGFELECWSYFFSWLPLPILILKSLPYWLGIKRKNNLKKSDHLQDNFILDLASKRELNKLKKGKKISWGSSILAVAKVSKQVFNS